MKNIFVGCIMLSFTIYSYGQFGPQQIVNNKGLTPRYVHAADIDNDGDMDVISAISGSDQTAWYENLNGQANFGPLQVISTNVLDVRFVTVADLDGDDAIDVLTTCFGDDMVLWNRNDNGLGGFGPNRMIADDAVGAIVADVADFDGDGDLDVVSANLNANSVTWYENIDGNGTFGTEKIISATISFPRFVVAGDIDGDGDQDVVAIATGTSEVFWYENMDGLGNFGTGNVFPSLADSSNSLYLCDIDGDTDLDLLVAATTGNRVSWFENTDGLGTFSPENIITTETDFVSSVFAIDLDNDLDLDVLSASANDGKIAWYENIDGQGVFGPQQVITTEAENARSVYAADLDGDGDNDVLSASITGNKVAWYENLTILAVPENTLHATIFYPNPTSHVLQIETEALVKVVQVYNSLDQVVPVVLKDTRILDVSYLSAGIYTVFIEGEDGATFSEKIVKE